jgi:hypothetical protein
MFCRCGPRSGSYRRAVWHPALAKLVTDLQDLDGHASVISATRRPVSLSEGRNIMAVQGMPWHMDASVTPDRYCHPYDSALIHVVVRLAERYHAA